MATSVHTLDESGIFAAEASAAGRLWQSPSAVNLVSSRGQEVGWIEVAKPMPGSFSREDEIALTDLAAQAADALDAAQEREARDHVRVDRLRQLADSVLGGGDFNELLDRVVAATADALDVEAASLYLFDEETSKLVIHVAVGRDTALLEARGFLRYGRGNYGRDCTEAGETVKADSSTTCVPASLAGEVHRDTSGLAPETFLGIPTHGHRPYLGGRACDRRLEAGGQTRRIRCAAQSSTMRMCIWAR